MVGPVAAYLPGGRLHLQHGPIDLIIGADGDAESGFIQAKRRFDTVLDQLVAELPMLRRDIDARTQVEGPVARRMCQAAQPFLDVEPMSPMIAVAGAVADEMLAEVTSASPLSRAFANNGGDIALHLAEGARFEIALTDHQGRPLGKVDLDATAPSRGVATSGFWGRSMSLGIATSVTVLAANAATADAAATLIANGVDLPDHPGIRRTPAVELQPDNDLGPRLAVTHVPELTPAERAEALAAGSARAQAMLEAGHIHGAALFLQGDGIVLGRNVVCHEGDLR